MPKHMDLLLAAMLVERRLSLIQRRFSLFQSLSPLFQRRLLLFESLPSPFFHNQRDQPSILVLD